MSAVRVDRSRRPARRAPGTTIPTKRTDHDAELLDESDDLLDQIDDILEDTADVLVNYRQKGGQ